MAMQTRADLLRLRSWKAARQRTSAEFSVFGALTVAFGLAMADEGAVSFWSPGQAVKGGRDPVFDPRLPLAA